MSILAPVRARAAAPSRLALVIGNADYAGAPLPTSANDAGLVAETLAQVGFDVTAMANVDAEALARTLQAFETKARAAPPDAVILVYLAGYGLQVDGGDFFVPIGAKIARGSDVPAAATRLSDLAKAIEAVPAKAHVFIEDLAYESPFSMRDGMPLAAGLALMPAPAGSLYALNAAPGSVAPAEMPPYGAYARALAEMIQTPGLDLPELFRRVRLRVGEYTDGGAVPWDDAKLVAPVALSGTPMPRSGAVSETPVAALSATAAYSEVIARDTLDGYLDFVRVFPEDPLTPRVRMLLALRREALFWLAASQTNNAAAYWTYMRRYPRRAHYYDARNRLAALDAPLEPPPRFDITLFPDVPPPSAEEAALLDRQSVIVTDPDWAPIPPPPAPLLPPSRSAFTDELAPPPLVPATVLPVPMPVARPPGAMPLVTGRITQPFVPLLGEVLAETKGQAPGATSVTLTAGPKVLISRIAMTTEKDGTRTITQTGPKDTILSRTTIIGDDRGATVVQTGPNGGVLTKSVTWTASDGARSTLIRNGGNQIVADITRNERGIVVSSSRAVASAPRVISSVPAPVHGPAPAPAYGPAVRATPPVMIVPTRPSSAPAPAPKTAADPVPVAPTAAPMPLVSPPRPPETASPASRNETSHEASPITPPPAVVPPPTPRPLPPAPDESTVPRPPSAKRASPPAPPPPDLPARTAPLPVPRPARTETKPKPASRALPKAKAQPHDRKRGRR